MIFPMSTHQLHLWPEDTTHEGEEVVINIALELPSTERVHLWYRLPVVHQTKLALNCDPFVLGVLFIAMYLRADLVVHGAVSPSLLHNLEEFQLAWHKWLPDHFSPVQILPDRESEASKADRGAALVAFSGGLDSTFTVFRHHSGIGGSRLRDISAGLFLHGFDIPLRDHEGYQRALAKTRLTLSSLGIETIPLATNLKKIHPRWNDAHGAILASCLSLFSGAYTSGLIASSLAYNQIILPWGSNPLTDPLLSSDAFEIVHDGAGYNRSDKVRAIADWPEALHNLRVCLVGEQKDRNCCRCEKCLRTILDFRAWGLGLPPCFEKDISVSQILGVKYYHPGLSFPYESIVTVAKQNGQSGAWVRAVKISLFLNRVYYFFLRIPWVRKFIKIFKGR